jgi:hypothetical protein
MGYLIFILAALGLLSGFIALTNYETRRGMRLFARERADLDAKVTRAEFIFNHVDFAAFAREELRRAGVRIGHDIAHLSLEAVRMAERLLTRLVRHLRSHRMQEGAPRESARPFVRTLSDFKGRLKKAARENGENTPE